MSDSKSVQIASFRKLVFLRGAILSSLITCLISIGPVNAKTVSELFCSYDGFSNQLEVEIDYNKKIMTLKGDIDTRYELTVITKNFITAIERGIVLDNELIPTEQSHNSESWLIERSTGRLSVVGFGGICRVNKDCDVGTMKPYAKTGSCSRKVL